MRLSQRELDYLCEDYSQLKMIKRLTRPTETRTIEQIDIQLFRVRYALRRYDLWC